MLMLNTSKSKYMIFKIKEHSLNHNFELKFHSFDCKFCYIDSLNCKCNTLEKVEIYKYLGITLDYKFKWSYHINNLISSLRTFFFIFKDVKRYFNIKMKRIIYIALVQSIFSYGIMFCGCTYSTHLEKLKTTINCIIKFLLSKPKYYSTSLFLRNLMYKIAMYKTLIKYFIPMYYYYYINISIY